MSQQINLIDLLPNVLSLQSDFSLLTLTSEQLSAIFVIALITVFFWFLISAIKAASKSTKRIRQMNKVLKTVTRTNISDERSNLKDKARPLSIGHLWAEFDETLIEVRSHNQSVVLHNTVDSNHFFNTSTLAPEITENRMLAAVPGFLTAIGVIGTFVGLQLGLSELHIGTDVAVEDMKAGLAQVISGAKIAFLTSVWGVILSLLFNIFEKKLERNARERIRKLQEKIDNLFFKMTPETQLQKIADNSSQSREDLQQLAEKIGVEFQKSMGDFATTISQPLHEFAGNAVDGSQKALNSLLENFMDKLGAEGDRQNHTAQVASENLATVLNSLNSSIGSLLNRFELTQANSVEREKSLNQAITQQITHLMEQSQTQQKLLSDIIDKKISNILDVFNKQETASNERESAKNEKVEALLGKLANAVDSQMAALQKQSDTTQTNSVEREKSLNQAITQQITHLMEQSQTQQKLLSDIIDKKISNILDVFNKQETASNERESAKNNAMSIILERLERTMQSQLDSSKQLLNQGEALQQNVLVSFQRNAEASTQMRESAEALKVSTQHMNEAGQVIKLAGQNLSSTIKDVVASTTHLAKENQSVRDTLQVQQKLLSEQQERFNQTIQQMTKLLDNANTAFHEMGNHQKSFLSQLRNELNQVTHELVGHVNQLSSDMNGMLKDYSNQVNAQTATMLKNWAAETTAYTKAMQDAIDMLSNVVDEIQEKVKK